MSLSASKWAWGQQVSPSEKLVLLAIADFASDDGGNAYPSVERVAKMAGLSTRTVIRAIGSLVEAGLLAVSKNHRSRGNAYNTYQLAIRSKVTPCHSHSDTMTPDPSLIRQIKNIKERTLISEDWKMSKSNVRLAASLGIPIPRGGGDWVEDEFRDWALMYGLKSSNWQAACATYLKKYANGEKTRQYQ